MLANGFTYVATNVIAAMLAHLIYIATFAYTFCIPYIETSPY